MCIIAMQSVRVQNSENSGENPSKSGLSCFAQSNPCITMECEYWGGKVKIIMDYQLACISEIRE